jgi:hypothetical protein
MESKHRLVVIFAMLSLTLLMLGFQNCSSSEGMNSSGSDDGGFIIDPPIVFASATSACSVRRADFQVADPLYLCVQNAGSAPTICIEKDGSGNCFYTQVISSASGWGGIGGNWVKNFTGSFPAGSTYTAYAIHTDDHTSFGQENFTVSP